MVYLHGDVLECPYCGQCFQAHGGRLEDHIENFCEASMPPQEERWEDLSGDEIT